MMQRLLTILLVPFFVVGNSLAYSHSQAAHASPSKGRAHFHFGSGGHHWHHHESHEHSHGRHVHRHRHEADDSQPTPTPPSDHDSDAIYVAAVDYVFSITERSVIHFAAGVVVTSVENDLAACNSPIGDHLQRYSPASGPPLYLLHAALRL